MENLILSKRLKELREKSGYKQDFVADKLGIKSNTLSGYENGNRSPHPEMLVELSRFYKVTTDYLLGQSEHPKLTTIEDNESREMAEKFRVLSEDKKGLIKNLMDQLSD